MPIVGYVLVPIADLFIGEDSYNPTIDEEAALKKNIWFRVVTWLYVVALTATLGVALHTILLFVVCCLLKMKTTQCTNVQDGFMHGTLQIV